MIRPAIMNTDVTILINDITRSAGTERAVVNLANLLVENGYRLTIISSYTAEGAPYFKLAEQVKIIHLNCPVNGKGLINRLKWSLSYIKAIRKQFTHVKPQFAIGTVHGLNMLLPFICIFGVTKAIACEHISYGSVPLYSRVIRNFLYYWLYAVVVLTEKDKARFARMTKVFVIPNSLSFAPVGLPDYDTRRILSVGRFTHQKGYDMLLSAAVLLKSRYSEWTISIFGEGELKDELYTQLQSAGLEGFVKFHPPTKAIQDEFLNSSVYVMSSRFEGLPMVLLEAQACGLPCVSFDCPEGPADIITDRKDGYLVSNGDIDGLANAMSLLMDNREQRVTFGHEAKEASKKYRKDIVFGKWYRLLHGATDNA
jgi:amylovoran biosynthesis glycosyltransferase AmsD